MPSGSQARGGSPGFALPILLLAVAVSSVGATRAEVSLSHRLARDREDELIFRGRAYVAAIRSFYLAEQQPLQRRLPASLEELERDPRFPLKRHIRQLYDDPMTQSPATKKGEGKRQKAFRTIIGSVGPGQPQGIIGIASTSDKPLLRRSFAKPGGARALGVKTASDLTFEVDLKQLADLQRRPTRTAPVPPRPARDLHPPSALPPRN